MRGHGTVKAIRRKKHHLFGVVSKKKFVFFFFLLKYLFYLFGYFTVKHCERKKKPGSVDELLTHRGVGES